MQASWNGRIIAESDATIVVEGNHYFPPDSIEPTHFASSATTTRCGWKGEASYFHVVVEGKTNVDAAWSYRMPLDAAKQIGGYVAFWRGVDVSE